MFKSSYYADLSLNQWLALTPPDTFRQPARSGRGGSARASAGDRAVAAQGGLASRGNPAWLPGVSGNPQGDRDNHLKHAVLRYARAKSMQAIKRLVALMDDPKAGKSVQLMAAMTVLDRALGRPKQTVDVEQQGRTLEDILRAIAAAREAEAENLEIPAETPK